MKPFYYYEVVVRGSVLFTTKGKRHFRSLRTCVNEALWDFNKFSSCSICNICSEDGTVVRKLVYQIVQILPNDVL